MPTVFQRPNYILKTFKQINLSFFIPKFAQCWFNLHVRDVVLNNSVCLPTDAE